MKLDSDCHRFPGKVKYAGSNQGVVPWKSGELVFTKENGSWKLELLYDCSASRPVLSLGLCDSKVERVICRESAFMLDYRKGKGEVLTVHYRPGLKSVVRSIQSIMDDVRTSKTDVPVVKCEVGVTKHSTPLKSMKTEPQDASPQRFTSVKENKKSDRHLDDLCNGDEKENLGSPNRPGEKFLQRSTEKSRNCRSFYGKSSVTSQPLFNSTPKNGWLNSKRQPGLMPDPTPLKRARLSDSIQYSMKAKPPQQSNQKQAPVLQGFSNLGNTCYMNSILQSLFCLDTFSTDLMNNRKLLKALPPQSLYKNKILVSNSFDPDETSTYLASHLDLNCLQTTALVKLLHVKGQQTSADETRRVCLKRVKNAISNTAKRFLGYGQHDAHEFLGQVLDQLKEEVIKVSKCTPSPNRENPEVTSPDTQGIATNPIIKNFEFEVVHSLTCLNCGECVMKAEQFHDVSLDLPKHKDQFTTRSLQDALSLFFKNEEIEYACEKCSHNKSFVTHKLTRLPRIFILHLKRYLYNQTFSRNTKMGQNVAIPQYVTLQNHCTEQTQPAFPPNLHSPGLSEQKSGSELDDSREDAPSRRKLQYPGYKFSKKGRSSSLGKEGDTEKVDKKDEVDSMQPRPLTLEDEEDPDFARAIEMSLKEQEDKDKMARDFGDDTEENFERVMELSRREDDDDIPDIKKKDFKDLSEEEMLQLAIEQSLLENHGNYTETDDITANENHFTQIDDVTSNGDHNYTRSIDTSHSTSVSRQTDSFDIEPDKPSPMVSEPDRHSPKDSSLTNCKTYSAKNKIVRKKSMDLDDLICLKTMPEEHKASADLDKHNTEDGKGVLDDDVGEEEGMQIDRDSEDCGKSDSKADHSWREKLKDLSSRFSSDGNESPISINSETDTDNDTAARKFKSNANSETSKQKTMYEVFRKQNGEVDCDEVDCDISNNCNDNHDFIDLTKATSADTGHKKREKLDHNDNITDSNCDTPDSGKTDKTQAVEIVDTDIEGRAPVQRKCQLTNKGDNSGLARAEKGDKPTGKGDSFGFDFDDGDDEDNSWMFSVDNKENTLPGTDKPRLSSPSEFNQELDTNSPDEVDGYIEENLDLPEIKNDKGDLPYSYRLVSIVNHMGLSTSTGHYLSDVYDMKKKSWYSYDDSHVTKMTQDDVMSKREKSGYIFFYMSKDIFDDVTLHNDTTRPTGNQFYYSNHSGTNIRKN